MRIKAIDIFRAITMVLMIFVNDLFTLSNIPLWLEHSKINVDFLGLADIVFPCFLFVLGMSILYAIKSRIAKGQTKTEIIKHIALRTVALVVMGVFTVNQPILNANATGMSKPLFSILMVVAFFMIWKIYNGKSKWATYKRLAMQCAGIVILIWLAIIFRGQVETGEGIQNFGIHWWGILGLIGWTYIACALLYLYAQKYILAASTGAFLVFCIVNIAANLWHANWFIGNGAFHAFTLAGMVASLVYEKYKAHENRKKLGLVFIIWGILMLAAGLLLRNFFIISKIHATPTWLMLCTGISLIMFISVYWLSDVLNKHHWFKIIGPAGSDTLTCYLMPYIFYAVFEIIRLQLSEMLTTGLVGLLKSLVFSFAVIGLTWLLAKIKLQIKV